jgi:uncharacterized membrane protein YhaH (DUF805 family)
MEWYLKVLKQHYFDFNGRARRKEYWMYTLVNIIVVVVLQILARMVPVLGLLAAIYGLAVLLPGLGVTARRLHDVGKSGWFMLLAFVPIVGLYLIYLLAKDSDAGSNAYGANPKA